MAILTSGAPATSGGRRRRKAGSAASGSSRWAIGLGVVLVLAALALVHLRTRGIQMRYQLAEALSIEQELLEEQRRLTLEVRRLRNPQHLAERAAALGLARPERVIALPRTPASTASAVDVEARR